MELDMNPRQPVRRAAAAFEPSHLWALGLADDDDAFHARAGKSPYSFWTECECPGDCLRDHENE
jgi:hypothetical protein